MGLLHKTSHSLALRTYLHHVIRKGDQYMCAVCSKSYPDLDHAESCLIRCWRKLGQTAHLHAMRAFGGVRYRCPLCMRLHRNEKAGLACLKDCKRNLRPHLSLVTLEDLPPPKEKKTFSKFKMVAAQRKKPSNEEEAQVENKEHTPQPVEVAPSPPPTAAAPAAAAEAPQKKVRDRTKKFTRDNAKYLCFECKKVFFTKAEAEACFDAHE